MSRLARMVVPGLPHHVTQRGNRREAIFFEDGDQQIYCDMLAEQLRKYSVEVWAYCLMPTHIHLIAVPHSAVACARTLGVGHMRYTQYRHRQSHAAGHLWQGRFFSAPLDEIYCSRAIRYVEVLGTDTELALE